jgi:hypothetical protein
MEPHQHDAALQIYWFGVYSKSNAYYSFERKMLTYYEMFKQRTCHLATKIKKNRGKTNIK